MRKLSIFFLALALITSTAILPKQPAFDAFVDIADVEIEGIFNLTGKYVCGDVNNDGSVNTLDMIYLIAYLFEKGPAPVVMESADVDSINGVNMADVLHLTRDLFAGGDPVYCPPYPDTSLIAEETLEIRNTMVLPGVSEIQVEFYLKSEHILAGYTFPFQYDCLTSDIICDSISYAGTIFSGEDWAINLIDESSKKAMLGIGFVNENTGPTTGLIASAHFSLTASTDTQYILIDTTEYDPSHIVIFTKEQPNYGSFVPNIMFDGDFDGIGDSLDNCINVYNPDQEDQDLDGLGDLCDNCPSHPNPNQEDFDHDNFGDSCDVCLYIQDFTNDADGDDLCGGDDNCVGQYNPGQEDQDLDNVGDICDNCINVVNTYQLNYDSDTLGDSCDNCPLIDNNNQTDTDLDGVGDACDNCINDYNPDQGDNDIDGEGDICDNDDDNDGILDAMDNCPFIANPMQEDIDLDDVGDACEGGNILNSTTEPYIILSPAGTIPFTVTLRDNEGMPVEGSSNCWLDFSRGFNMSWCRSEDNWPLVYSEGLSDADGTVVFYVAAGGSTYESVKVMSTHGIIAEVPIRTLDVNGNLHIEAADFVQDIRNDYNFDGVIDLADWEFFESYLGEECRLGDPSQYMYMRPTYAIPDGNVFTEGDTIHICTELSNISDYGLTVGKVIYETKDYSIGGEWILIDSVENEAVNAGETVTLCAEYIIPNAGHRCYRVRVRNIDYSFNENPIQNKTINDFSFLLDYPIRRFHEWNITVKDAITLLRNKYNIPISFIEAYSDKPVDIDLSNVSLGDILDKLTNSISEYTFEIIGKKLIVYPDNPNYQIRYDNLRVSNLNRIDAGQILVDSLKEFIPSFHRWAGPLSFSGFCKSIYNDTIDIDESGRVIDYLVQLIEGNPLLYLSADYIESGLQLLRLKAVRENGHESLRGDENCRPLGLNQVLVQRNEYHDSMIGIEDVYNILSVDEECGSSGYLTEEVLQIEACTGVETFAGTDVGCCGQAVFCCPDGCEQPTMDVHAIVADTIDMPKVPFECRYLIVQDLYFCGYHFERLYWEHTIGRLPGAGPSYPFYVYTTGPEYGEHEYIPPCDDTSPPDDDGESQLNTTTNECPIQKFNSGAKRAPMATDTSSFLIPININVDDSLKIYQFAFLPDEWSYSVSDSGWIYGPDTIAVDIYHNELINPDDTALVTFFGYDDHQRFVGYAEVMVVPDLPLFLCGDANSDWVVNILDITYLIAYLYKDGPEPSPMEAGDVNSDSAVNILDITYLIAYLYKDGPEPDCL